MGLQREAAGRGSMADYTQLVFATILQLIFFHAIPSALSMFGTLIIIAGALYVAVRRFLAFLDNQLIQLFFAAYEGIRA